MGANAPTETPLVPVAPPAASTISQEDHNRILVDNAVLRARIEFPTVPEELLRKFKGEKPDDVIAFAKFAAEQLKTSPPVPSAPPAPTPPPTGQASGAAASTVSPSGGEPVPAPGVGGTPSPAAVTDMRIKELRQKVLRKTATSDEANELADTVLIRSFNKHMKERRARAS